MGWFLVLLLIATGVPIFAWAHRRHLDVLTGRWIANGTSPRRRFADKSGGVFSSV